jgi:hypothetical protein
MSDDTITDQQHDAEVAERAGEHIGTLLHQLAQFGACAPLEQGYGGSVLEAAQAIVKLRTERSQYRKQVDGLLAPLVKAAKAIRGEEIANFAAAIGDKPLCECDHSVGMAPCMDCAMRAALRRLRAVFEAAQKM